MQHRRLGVVLAVALVVASCSSGSDDADATLPDITLVTTTTTTTIPVFEPSSTSTSTSMSTTTAPTTTTTTTSSTTTTVAPDPATTVPADFSLALDGLGAAAFGADPDGVIGFISSFVGPPTADTGYIDPFELGACGGTQVRQVSWGSLVLEFGDVSNVAFERLHFYAYLYGTQDPAGLAAGTPAGLTTPEGIGFGSSVAELLAAYPDAQFLERDEFIADTFIVNDNLRGQLTGLTDLDTVTVIIGGLPCEG